MKAREPFYRSLNAFGTVEQEWLRGVTMRRPIKHQTWARGKLLALSNGKNKAPTACKSATHKIV